MKYIIIVTLFLLISCGNGSTDPGINIPDIYKGTQGLTTSIEDNAFPSSIYPKQSFELILRYDNKGPIEVPVDNVKSVIVLEPGYLGLLDSPDIKKVQTKDSIGYAIFTEKFDGKGTFNNFDAFAIINSRIVAKGLDPMSEYHNAIIVVRTCYDYLSKAYPDICIDFDPHGTTPDEKVCISRPVSLSQGQGGPLVISSIEPIMLGSGNEIIPQFKIHIQNVGSGSITKYGETNTFCASDGGDIDEEDYNYFEITKFSFSSYTLRDFTCEPNAGVLNRFKLRGKEDTIICTKNSAISGTNYLTPLEIEIRYGYADTLTREILIERV